MASLQSVNIINNDEFYACSIRQLLIQLGTRVQIVWVPSHTQIRGNEIADKAAKNATRSPLTTLNNLSISDISNCIKFKFKNKKKKICHGQQHRNGSKKLIQEKNNILEIIKSNQRMNLSRRDQVIISRLRLGNTKITHSHLIDKNVSNMSSFCNSTQMSLKHILAYCNYFQTERTSIFSGNNILNILNNLTSKNVELILKYIKKFNLYNLI